MGAGSQPMLMSQSKPRAQNGGFWGELGAGLAKVLVNTASEVAPLWARNELKLTNQMAEFEGTPKQWVYLPQSLPGQGVAYTTVSGRDQAPQVEPTGASLMNVNVGFGAMLGVGIVVLVIFLVLR